MNLTVLKDYKSFGEFCEPIELIEGETVTLGEMTDPDGVYPDRVLCDCPRTGRKGVG